jgi:DNA-binding XRE family transcriptional regulator
MLRYLETIYTHGELAHHLDCSAQTVSNIKVGRTQASERISLAIRDLYEYSQPAEVEIGSLWDSSDQILVDTPDGFQPMETIFYKGQHGGYEAAIGGSSVITTDDHLFETKRGWVYCRDLTDRDSVLTESGWEPVLHVRPTGDERRIFDLEVGHRNHRYWANGISSHNSGVGKSLMLANVLLNYAERGQNVVYITHELYQDQVAKRQDSMVTGVNTREIFSRMQEVHDLIKLRQKTYGNIYIKYLPPGSNCNDISAYLKELKIRTGIRIHAIGIDYLDLLESKKKIKSDNLWIKDKYVTEEVRALAGEEQCPVFTASQLVRGAMDEEEHRQSHIAGGISKINTADNVISIYQSAAMKEDGMYQLQFLKTRNSSGVGKKVPLLIDLATLRIRDAPDEMLVGQPARMKPNADMARAMSDTPVFDKTDIGESKQPLPVAPAPPPVKSNMDRLASIKAKIGRRV